MSSRTDHRDRDRDREHERDRRDRDKDRDRSRQERTESDDRRYYRDSRRSRDSRDHRDRERGDDRVAERSRGSRRDDGDIHPRDSRDSTRASKRPRESDDMDTGERHIDRIEQSSTKDLPVAAPSGSKFSALNQLLAMKKAQLEAEKQSLLKTAKPSSREQDETAARELAQKEMRMRLGEDVNKEQKDIDAQGNFIMPVISRHSTLLANQKYNLKKEKVEPKKEPVPRAINYFDPDMKGTRRKARKFKWVEPGKFAKEAEEVRLAAQMVEENNEEKNEEKPIAEEEVEAALSQMRFEKKQIIGDDIPEIEWWDKPFLLGHSEMARAEAGLDSIENSQYPRYYGPAAGPIPYDTGLINSTVVHPVPVLGPGDSKPMAAQPLKYESYSQLTAEERRRIKKQAKQQRRQEEQDAILLGIKEAPPPRVRIANMVRVYGATAISDPTQIETMVRTEMDAREQRHYERNQARKLTPEQRREKKIKKVQEDLSLATTVCLFKVTILSPLNRKKIELNAQQLLLRGCCITGPEFSIVAVEGGPKALRRYKKLMTRRIQWEPAIVTVEGKPEPVEAVCDMIWEGQVLQASFMDFQMKKFGIDGLARKFLADRGVGHYWDMAKTYKRPDLD